MHYSKTEIKKGAFSTSLYFVSFFIYTFLWNLVIFKDIYLNLAGPLKRDVPIFAMGLTSILIQGIALSILFSMFYKGEKPVRESLTLVSLVGVFDLAFGTFFVPASFNINPILPYFTLEFFHSVIHFLIAAPIYGFIYRKNY